MIKDRLDQADGVPASRNPDLWVLGPRFDGAQLTVHPGDRIVITSENGRRPSVTCSGGFTDVPVKPASSVAEMQVTEDPRDWGRVQVTDISGHWEFAVQVEGQRCGIDSRWVG